MASTTNYGWTTPDDTALVKDGASAIRTLGSSIDTTTKALNPSTTLGDIEYRSATANTNTRLPLGTAGQVLQVNSGATAPEWATPAGGGGLTLLSTTTLSGSSTTISSINQSYTNLYIYVRGVTINTNTRVYLAPNNSSSANNQIIHYTNTGGAVTAENRAEDYIFLSVNDLDGSSGLNAWSVNLENYANTSGFKPFNVDGGSTANGALRPFQNTGVTRTTSAITSLVFVLTSGSFTGGTVLLYGVK